MGGPGLIDPGALSAAPALADGELDQGLEQAGYVRVRKGYVGKRPRTWLSLTERGRTAFAGHVAALRAIVEGGGWTQPDRGRATPAGDPRH